MHFKDNQDTATNCRNSNSSIAVDITHTPPTLRFDSDDNSDNSHAANVVNIGRIFNAVTATNGSRNNNRRNAARITNTACTFSIS